jgi:hypothetical protein
MDIQPPQSRMLCSWSHWTLRTRLDAAHKMAGPHHLSKFLSKLARRFQIEADETEGSALH